MPILVVIIVGAAAGFIATRMMRIETGILPTIAIGVLGAIIGGVVIRVLVTVSGYAAGFVGAVLGALLLIWAWERYGPRR